MKLGIGIGITGRVVAERIRPDGDLVERLEFDNVILNVGWSYLEGLFGDLNVNALYPTFLVLGTGTTEPSAEDNGLQNISPTLAPLPATAVTFPTGFRAEDRKSGWSEVQLRFDYPQGAAAGTWTELGLSYQNPYLNPFNRALFRNESNNPTAITVLADEYLRITVTLRKYVRVPTENVTFAFNGETITGNILLTTNGLTNGMSSFSWWRSWPFQSRTRGAVRNYSDSFIIETTFDLPAKRASSLFYNPDIPVFDITRITFVTNAAPFIEVFLSPGMNKNDGWIMEGSWSIQFFRDCVEMATGTATSGTTTTLTDTTKTWTVDQFKNKRLLITGGAGEGETLRIASNTVDTLTFAVAASVAIDNTSTYRICSNG